MWRTNFAPAGLRGRVILGKGNRMDNNEHSTNLAEVGTDCISREQAIDALRKMQTYKMFSGDDMLLIDQAGAQTELMLLPPIQPKRGRWHYSDGKPARIGLSFGVICDQCGTESEYCTNFCGECGADMREVTT